MRLRACLLCLTLTGGLLLPGCGAPKPTPAASAATPQPKGVKDLPATAYQVEWGAFAVPATMAPGSQARLEVSFKNASPVAWPAGVNTGLLYTVRLSHRWLQTQAGSKKPAEVVGYGGHRVELPRVLGPGESLTLTDTLTAPVQAGRYVVQFDLVHEGVSWFADRGAAVKTAPVEVQ